MTKKEIDDLKKYLENNTFTSYFGMFCKLYSMTTENIYGFLSKYDLRDKRILTVAGSGDQRLNAYLLGASDVTCFDINPLSELHMELKDNAIKALDYEEFLDFFGIVSKLYDKNSILDFRLFDKLGILLNSDTYDFFDYIIKNKKNSEIYFEGEDLDTLEKMNGYFNVEGYNKLKNIIKTKSIDFIGGDVCSLPDRIRGEKFDMILLSNISDYTHFMYKDDGLLEYRELIDRLMDNLNLYGILQVGYIYSMYARGDDVSNFHFNKNRYVYFPTSIFHSNFVDSYYNDGTYDKIITYQKLK